MSIQTNKLPDNPQIEVIKSGKTGLFTNYIYKAIPLAFDESMSYYETLCGLLNYLQNTIIPTVNNNADAVAELQNLYEQLRSYVDNYFTNLDVQEEINNKLDQMVTDGTLPEIIASYLNSKAIFGFDNVESMKNATNLINGSYAQTLGFYNKNDGGSALYKIRNITNDDVVDNMFIIPLNGNELIAELIYDVINLKQIGCYGDNVHDDGLKIKTIFENLKEKDIVYIPKGTYLCDVNMNINVNNIKIYGDGRDISIINLNQKYINFTSNQLKIENIGFTNQNKIEITGYHNTIKSCSINYGTNGLILNNAYIVQVLNTYITQNSGIGIILNNESYETIIDNSVIDNNYLGILVIGVSTGARISNCTIEGNRNRTSNQGVGLAISCTSADLHISNCWFETNGSSNNSADIINLGIYNDSEISSIVDYVSSLYTFNLKDTSGIIEVKSSHFTFTKYGIITNGYKNKTIIENNTFSGKLDLHNKPILYYTNYTKEEILICNNNQITNTGNQAITEQMLNGVKLSYIYTNIEITDVQKIKNYIKGTVLLDNKPLFVYEENIKNLSNVKFLYQYQNGGTKYNSGYLLGNITDSYSTSGTTYITNTKDSSSDFDIFDDTENITSFVIIENFNATLQCRTGNNKPTDITPYEDGLFPIINKQLYNKKAFALNTNQVIFALIQFNANEKKASKQCLAFKPTGYYFSIYNPV
ncbi:MAG: right-handed parallel beta-helix repeat-containing protein [Methanobrevibacter boviskoreani]|uniref:right-handed parallel beta-helix repeat-containing protein n=1 Tax=Methanobrevibacter boviskoreani TaxID=1348249 RepID=UPI0023A7C1EA|nr:right-handed parallel beta-helix repeat-containing protein [Methanobrevibacter boviskoreani]MCI6931091.1 right-handed parallel beta-helix repeat-containing protein [Methanobrevibacter boviskoreani]